MESIPTIPIHLPDPVKIYRYSDEDILKEKDNRVNLKAWTELEVSKKDFLENEKRIRNLWNAGKSDQLYKFLKRLPSFKETRKTRN